MFCHQAAVALKWALPENFYLFRHSPHHESPGLYHLAGCRKRTPAPNRLQAEGGHLDFFDVYSGQRQGYLLPSDRVVQPSHAELHVFRGPGNPDSLNG